MNLPFRLPLMAILRGILPEQVEGHVGALVKAGFDAIEIPLNSPDWEESIKHAVRLYGDKAMIGGGTVMTTGNVDTLHAIGARLIVTPNTRPALIRHAVGLGMHVAAGFATASEAFDAIDAGAGMLKLFPASTYGPGHVKALRAVLPPVPVFAVGGVSPDALPVYLAAGCAGAGLGGELFRRGQSVEETGLRATAFRTALEESRG